jgi:3D (Asp-Asp-Asp) domain-containing protein
MNKSDHTGRAFGQARAPGGGRTRGAILVALLLGLAALPSCALFGGLQRGGEQEMVVSASAFNSLPGQTDHSPAVTAFGTHLRPGMRVVAVSSDLYDLGLKEGTRLRIEGLPGEWRVADRMNPRWRRKIDIYMGTDVHAARRWGVRKVEIHWRAP